MVFRTHKTREWRVHTRRNQLEISIITITQLEGWKMREIMRVKGFDAVNQFATKRGDKAVF